ncbi:MAG: endonuclease [Bacteroidales bacterium]|nr:endonuclease [Bacteroidales bacterium]
MKKHLLLITAILWAFSLSAQEPAGYYNAANGKKGQALRIALAQIINNNAIELSYGSGLWNAFLQTDVRNNKIWDIYSDIPGGTPPYEYTPGTNQCGNYSGEGNCYNKEHSVPASWFGNQTPMYSDLFHIYPTDGYVNNRRSNYPYGEVGNASWTSRNGSKLGSSVTPGYSETVFEPIDAYKGDLARGFFYMCTRYYNRDFDKSSPSMFTDGNLNPWALAMLIRWHEEDPVSQKEIDRNNAVYALQHNRNPFIDYPELVGKIFGADSVNAFHYGSAVALINPALVAVYPNPAHEQFNIHSNSVEINEIVLFDLMGKEVLHTETWDNHCTVNVSHLPAGLYLLKITSENQAVIVKKIVIQ